VALSSRRILTGIVLGLATVTTLAAAPASAVEPRSAQYCAPDPGAVKPLDGFVITHLPDGLGPLQTDFEFEWEDVTFHSRVWETGPDPEGGYKVDLMLKTVRGEALTDLDALRTFMTEYHDQDPDEWELTPVKLREFEGYSAGDRVFWFVSPGVAAEASVDGERLSEQDLMRTARGFRPETGDPRAA